jgi:hypothetical protein
MSLKPIFLAAKSPQNRENTPVYPAILVRFFAQKSQFFPRALVSGQALTSTPHHAKTPPSSDPEHAEHAHHV